MTTIYFVRHAQPNSENHDDELRELTERGLKERELVTDFLSDKSINIVLSSPFKRAVDTIKDFADKYKHEIVFVNDFRERKIDGVWIDDFNSFAKKQWEDFSYKLSDGETLGEVQSRSITALTDVLDKYEGKNIVVGSHGTALCTMIHYHDNSFNYKNFEKIKNLMPWIVQFTFDQKKCIQIKEYDLFTNQSGLILQT